MSVESLKKYAYFILDLNSPKYLVILNINKQLEVDSKKVPALGQAINRLLVYDIYEYNYNDSLI